MFKLGINIAFLSLILGPIGLCFIVFIKYVANDISSNNKARAKIHYPEHVEEKRVSANLRVVK